jgi:hypothetical protein
VERALATGGAAEFLVVLAPRLAAGAALAGGNAGFGLRIVPLILAALGLGVTMLVLSVMEVGLAPWTRLGDSASTHETGERQPD